MSQRTMENKLKPTKQAVTALIVAYARKIYSARMEAGMHIQQRYHNIFMRKLEGFARRFPDYDTSSLAFYDELENRANKWWGSQVMKGPGKDW
jgi:hypothetical protein